MSGIAFGRNRSRGCPRVFFSFTKHWKGVYLHFDHGTLRLFRSSGKWGSDYVENFYHSQLLDEVWQTLCDVCEFHDDKEYSLDVESVRELMKRIDAAKGSTE
jgi:hypothetical protein